MVVINKTEKEHLESEGFSYPEDLHHTLGKANKKTFYATESKEVMDVLEKYRKSITK